MSDDVTKHDIERDKYYPDLTDRSDYSSVVAEDVTIHQYMQDAYHGTGGFRNGKYLIPFPIEGYYDRRREFSHYTNFFSAVIDAMINPVFSKDPKRKIMAKGKDTENDFWTGFVENCNNSGKDLTKFIRENVITNTRINSISFVVVDNFDDSQLPETVNESIRLRRYPYIYSKTAQQVKEHKNDDFGNLVEISFYDKKIQIKDAAGYVRQVQTYRQWNSVFSQKYYEEKGKKIPIDEPKYHYLGITPVVPVLDKDCGEPSKLLPDPGQYDVARLCDAIYQQDSEIRELARKQGFSVLTMPGDPVNDLAIGAGSALFYPYDSSNIPQYISPDAQVLKGLIDLRNQIRSDLYGIAEQSGVVAVKGVKSGIAHAYEFQAHKFVLDETADICEYAEQKIFEIFSAYMVWENSYTYEVSYNRQYLPYDNKELVEHDEMLLSQNLPLTFRKKILEDNFRRRFPYAEQEEIDEMLSEYEAEQMQSKVENTQINFNNEE